MFFKRLNIITGEIIFGFNIFMLLIGHNGLINLICLVLNIANFNDEFFELFYDLNEKKEEKESEEKKNKTGEDYLKDKRLRKIYNEDDWNGSLGQLLDIPITICYILLIITFIFPIKDIMDNSLTLSPSNNLNILNKLGDIRNLHIYMTYLIIYILSFSLIYYVNYAKKKINFVNIIKIIFFSLLSIIYLMHSMNIFYAGFKSAMTTKAKGNLFYSITDNSYKYLHKFNLVSSYSIKQGFFKNELRFDRKELLIKYSIQKNYSDETFNKTLYNNFTNENNTKLNESNSTINKNNNSINYTIKNNTNHTKLKEGVKMNYKKEWIEINFRKKPISNEIRGNLKYFSSFFNQPRIDIAFHNLAYEKNLRNNSWVINLMSKIFNKDKKLYNYLKTNIPESNIEEIKIDSFESFYDESNNKTFINRFKSNFLRKLNKTIIDDFNLKFNKKYTKSMEDLFLSIPIIPIIITLNLILLSITILGVNEII
jgi:hypothetical protein